MRLLSLAEVLYFHEAILVATRGAPGVPDLGALESAVAQALESFTGRELLPSIAEKAGGVHVPISSASVVRKT